MAASSGVITTGDPGHAVGEHNPVSGLAHDTRGGISNPILGMILFICSEVMFFSGLFAAYFATRAASPKWPFLAVAPEKADAATKAAADALNEHFNLHAEPWFALILTLILVTSSVTCQL